MYITDENDEDPKFVEPRYEVNVLEVSSISYKLLLYKWIFTHDKKSRICNFRRFAFGNVRKLPKLVPCRT